jgi:hypothetical protein
MFGRARRDRVSLVASTRRVPKNVALELTLGQFRSRAADLLFNTAAVEIADKNQVLTGSQDARPGRSLKVGIKATGKTCG